MVIQLIEKFFVLKSKVHHHKTLLLYPTLKQFVSIQIYIDCGKESNSETFFGKFDLGE
jgi:hypothetical protein